ncbi:preprotein translocase subunit SecG [Compostibacter hankyongensis]|uniref:Protein-export membrane protein SecG n=1 Tax=Compostibacter hankyongensis TaxID=1007089 RepID=A0ABP8FVX4_9BACT
MLIFFGILIIVASVLLGLFVLIQNPKGGGLSGTFGGFSNQVMGVRQTTDILERGTWILAVIIGALCLASSFFLPRAGTGVQQKSIMEKNVNSLPAPAQAPAAPFPGAAQPQQGSQPAAQPANGNGAQPAAPASDQK